MSVSSDSIRVLALAIVGQLRDQGHEAYFAGGCVRDRLMGMTPKDYDIATDARPDRVLEIFPRGRRVGESFGVILVRRGGHAFEIATFRSDGPYSDGRRPDTVEFCDAEHDARRRDFTINGLFEDPVDERVIDYVDGRRDIESRLVRAIGDPRARIAEDRLRMLRAVRFAARFGFDIESDTAAAIREAAETLRGVSRERVGEEVRAMMNHPSRATAADLLVDLDLDPLVFEEIASVAFHPRLDGLGPHVPLPAALAAWARDRHGDEASARVGPWRRALVLSNAESRRLREVLDICEVLIGGWPDLGVAEAKRLAARPAFAEALAVRRAEDPAAATAIEGRVGELTAAGGLQPDPLLTGDDLVEASYAPGPAFKAVLDAVYDAQLEGRIASREDALALAASLLER